MKTVISTAAMVPAEFVLLDDLPVTPNGKIDYAALPVPDRNMTDEKFVAPRTDAEEGIARIWSQILGGKRIGVHDDFFELGGHSLSATQVVARLQSEFHIQLPVRALFDHPTVAGLAEAVAAANKPASAGERHKRPARGIVCAHKEKRDALRRERERKKSESGRGEARIGPVKGSASKHGAYNVCAQNDDKCNGG